MPNVPNRPLFAALERRRGELDRARSMQGRRHRVVGFVDVIGAGESLSEVAFPVWFLETPMMSFGGELAPNEVLVDRYFPTISVLVKSWTKVHQAGAEYISGATLILVTTGRPEQRIKAHWQAEGKALVNPISSTGSIDEAI